MVTLSIPITDQITEIYIKEYNKSHQENDLQDYLKEVVKEAIEKKRILDGIEEAVNEVNEVEEGIKSGRIDENKLQTMDDFFKKYK